MTTAVLVHGGGGSPNDWTRVIPHLDRLGVPSIAVDLPSGRERSELDDIGEVRSILDGCDGPVVLVGHSYGGMVITEVGDHPAVKHLVYLDAALPDAGESMMALLAGQIDEEFGRCLEFHDGAAVWNAEALTAYFVSRGWSERDAQEGVGSLRPQRGTVMQLMATKAAWRSVPSTYISCADSEMKSEIRSVFAARAGTVIELPGDHFPHWRRPDEVAEIIARVARDAAG